MEFLRGRGRPLSLSRDHPWLRLAALLVALAVLMPVAALIVLAASAGFEDWPHLASTILPISLRTTLLLMTGVALATAVMGIVPAWLTAQFEFPGRRVLSWALVLPLAVPPYLAAYAYGEFLHFTGPPQTLLRNVLGVTAAGDYWFPDVRSLGGGILVLSAVLYPYVFLTARAAFLMQGRNAGDIARTLGASPAGALLRVLLPMARPAIIVGITLALMETLNDIGAVEFLGIRTLTSAVYATWLNRGSLGGAAQLSCVMLAIVLAVIAAERWARRKQRFHLPRATAMVQRGRQPIARPSRRWLAAGACALPILLGFGLPVYVLGGYALRRLDQLLEPSLHAAIATSLGVASAAAVVATGAAFLLAYAVRVTGSRAMVLASRAAAIGYAVPGTILAIGILVPLARFDNALDGWMDQSFGLRTGLLLTGSAACLVYALSVRFLAMAEGAIDSGFHKIPAHLDMAARTLGRNARQTLGEVLLPLLRPAFLTAGLLVFIDSIKELSATILLRPFGFNSLSTYVYERASRSAVEEASVAALLIMLAGILPVLLLSRTMDAGIVHRDA